MYGDGLILQGELTKVYDVMTALIKIDGEYANWIKDLSLRFRQSQIKAAIRVNSEMLRFYFSLGADIVNKKAESRWGDGFFKNLSRDLQNALPGVRGFSEKNLYYMKLMYLLYRECFEKFPQMWEKSAIIIYLTLMIYSLYHGVTIVTLSTNVKKILTRLFSM